MPDVNRRAEPAQTRVTATITFARLTDIRRVLQHPQGAAVVLKTGDVLVIEPAVARLAAEIGASDRRPGDPTDQVLAEAAGVGRLQ